MLRIDVRVAHRARSVPGRDDRSLRVRPEPCHDGGASEQSPREAAVTLVRSLARDAEHRADLRPRAAVPTCRLDEVVDDLIAEHAQLGAQVAGGGDTG